MDEDYRIRDIFSLGLSVERNQSENLAGCTYFLNSVGFGPVCKLHGVYRDATQTYVMRVPNFFSPVNAMSCVPSGELQFERIRVRLW